jgi:SAM-dependent methyltransferase
MFPRYGPEISDAIISFDPETLERRPVSKQKLIRRFNLLGNRTAARIIEQIPARDDLLDPAAVDRLLIAAHYELQRMSEEFQHGQRVAEILRPLLLVLRQGGVRPPIRIVDIGCGTGFIVRWLAAHRTLGPDLELVGADYNVALVEEARRLAAAEGLPCAFVVANAFQLAEPASIYLSMGILHHFRGRHLVRLFAQHNREGTCAFVHFDFQASVLAPFGSWLFHAARMRQPLARHDGVLSAVRAHKSRDLLEAARAGAPDFVSAVYGTRLWGLPIPRALHALVGVRPVYREGFVRALGRRAALLGSIQ